MASFDSAAFDTNSFDINSFSFDSGGPSVITSDGGDIWPPRANDPRWQSFMSYYAVPQTQSINYDVRLALGLALSIAEADIIDYSVDDMWRRYLISVGRTDLGSKDTLPPS